MLADAEVHRRLNEVRARIAGALSRARRPPDSCRLVLATKTQTAEALLAAWQAGARDFGENYVQEAATKRITLDKICANMICPERSESASGVEELALSLPKGSPRSVAKSHRLPITWHLIGHLQTNKAAAALANFSLIHSLDSARLASALHHLQPIPPVRTLLEINLGNEPSKTGVAPDQAEALLNTVRDRVEVLGLMTIPPHSVDPSDSRPYFVRLRELRDRLAAVSGLALSELSMGMTDDYTIAIEEGATIVRVGRAVFGERT
jgi:uncharacterized pyridoxal phosphate-containing UPF0001 family protein